MHIDISFEILPSNLRFVSISKYTVQFETEIRVTVNNPIFILDFKLSRVLSVVFFLLGDSPASEFFFLADISENSVCSMFVGGVRRKNNWGQIAVVLMHVQFFL